MNKYNIILFYKIEYDLDEFYYRRINNDKSIFKLGKVKDNKFYEWISYNKFKKTPEKLPELEEIKIPHKIVNAYLYGNNKNITNEVQEIKNNLYEMVNVGKKFRIYKYLISIRNDKKVIIFKKDKIKNFENNIIALYFFRDLNYLQYNIKIKTYLPKKIFITKYNNRFYVLLHISDNKYLYICYNGQCYKFISYTLITKFGVIDEMIYAIDNLNNFYDIDHVNFIHRFNIMTKNNINMSTKKLYELYKFKHIIHSNKNSFIKNFQNIDKVYLYEIEHTLYLDLDLDRHFNTYYPDKKSLFIVKKDGSKEILNKKKYMKLMKDYEDVVGIHKLKYKRIYNK